VRRVVRVDGLSGTGEEGSLLINGLESICEVVQNVRKIVTEVL
jgi:hypothetical protein